MSFCTRCGCKLKLNLKFCTQCGLKCDFSTSNKDHQTKDKSIVFECIVCQNEFSINAIDTFNAFACIKCKSIFSYEWKNNKCIINVIKKEKNIPKELIILMEYFEIEYPIEKNKLKTNYRKLLSQYHPDKVLHMGKEFKELAEQKTKEIIKNYESIQYWIKE